MSSKPKTIADLSPGQLRKLARTRFGERWHAKLGKRLGGVHRTTVQRWDREGRIPPLVQWGLKAIFEKELEGEASA